MLKYRFAVYALVCVVAVGFGLLTPAKSALAQDSLSEQGVSLSDVQVELGPIDLSRDIDLNGDVPVETYVAAFFSNGTALKRTNSGYWLDWDGNLDNLVDTRASAQNGNVNFKILKEDISDLILPATIMLAYRVGETFKFGVFQIMAN